MVWNVSPSGDLAVKLGRFRNSMGTGVLAHASLSGGAPRELLENVQAAAWSPDGRDLAVIRRVNSVAVLEYPIGTVLYQAPDLPSLCVLPNRQVGLFERVRGTRELPYVISMVDGNGAHRVLSEGWAEGTGPPVWSQPTKEIFFPGWTGAGDVSLNAVSLSGTTRTVARVPGDFRLEDVDRRGRILLTRHLPRGGVIALAPGETQERDLSWLDFSFVTDLSADGRLILLGDFGGELGPSGGIAVRATDGGPVIDLGRGGPLALSADGRHVLAVPSSVGPGDRLLVIPVGAGERRELRHPSLARIWDAAWFDDGRRLIVLGGPHEGGGSRLYFWDPENGAEPRPISPKGEFPGSPVVSPNGLWVSAARTGVPLSIYPVDGGAPQILPGGRPDDEPLRWSPDSRWLFVRRGQGTIGLIERVEIATGRWSAWKEIRPTERAGLFGLHSFVITPDGKSYAYTFGSSIGSLYLAEGLK